jgi:magnesium-transporting ATPase (P-type)
MLLKEDKNSWLKKPVFKQIIIIAFESALLSYLFFYLIDILSPEFISRFYSMNYHLVFVLILGILTIFLSPSNKDEPPPKKSPVGIKEITLIIALVLLSIFIVWFKVRELGWMSYLISGLSGAIILVISILIMSGDID